MASFQGQSYSSKRRRVVANVDKIMTELLSPEVIMTDAFASLFTENVSDSEGDNLAPLLPTNETELISPCAASDELDFTSILLEGPTIDENRAVDDIMSQKGYDYNDHSDFETENESQENEEGDIADADLQIRLADWGNNNSITLTALGSLLTIVRLYHPTLPKDPRTLLRTLKDASVQELASGGQFRYFGLSQIIEDHHDKGNIASETLSLTLQVNIDGLPLYKSSSYQF